MYNQGVIRACRWALNVIYMHNDTKGARFGRLGRYLVAQAHGVVPKIELG